jgi:hypothetical protein
MRLLDSAACTPAHRAVLWSVASAPLAPRVGEVELGGSVRERLVFEKLPPEEDSGGGEGEVACWPAAAAALLPGVL